MMCDEFMGDDGVYAAANERRRGTEDNKKWCVSDIVAPRHGSERSPSNTSPTVGQRTCDGTLDFYGKGGWNFCTFSSVISSICDIIHL
jgi:hypothetical protein